MILTSGFFVDDDMTKTLSFTGNGGVSVSVIDILKSSNWKKQCETIKLIAKLKH